MLRKSDLPCIEAKLDVLEEWSLSPLPAALSWNSLVKLSLNKTQVSRVVCLANQQHLCKTRSFSIQTKLEIEPLTVSIEITLLF